MPELPEVETVMRGLEPHLQDHKITTIKTYRKDLRIPFPKDLKQTLESKKIISLKRRAKYILINLEGGVILSIHLGMSGRIQIIDKSQKYDRQKHDHFEMVLSNKTRIIYNDPRRFGMIFTLANDDVETHKAFKHLGPEPLGNGFSAEILKERLKSKTVSIKQALLDQTVVVGVGNIYACEALYMAGIHPKKPAGKISLKKLEELVRCIREVLSVAIEAGGSTLKDYRQASGELGYFQHQFKVYDREGEVCNQCASQGRQKACIKRIVQSGRSTFYCSKTQKI
ncbi:MAG: bifunctional DNA-formamidopyrimidine glycosylase/DNA-(apurinic or apyrimidinic site) lyase [Pseudomonadota bacterium]